MQYGVGVAEMCVCVCVCVWWGGGVEGGRGWGNTTLMYRALATTVVRVAMVKR